MGMATAARPVVRERSGWPLVGAGTALVAVTYGLARYGYALYLPTLRREFALSASAAGTLALLSYLSYGLAICAGATLSSRGHARATAILAGATAAAGMGAIAAARSVAELGAGMFVAGLGTGLASPPLVALVGARVRRASLGRALTTVNAGTGLGVLVAGPFALLLAASWRWSWALFAALGLAVTIAVAATTTATAAAGRGAPREPCRPRYPTGARPLAVASAGVGLASSAYLTFGRDLLAASGTPTGAAVAVWMTLGAASILAAVTGDLVARFRIDAVWAGLLLACGLATAALPLVTGTLPLVLAGAVLFGASYVALTGVLILWATRLAPERAASAVAATLLLTAGGQLAGAGATGVLVDRAGWTAAFVAGAAIALAITPLGILAARDPHR